MNIVSVMRRFLCLLAVVGLCAFTHGSGGGPTYTGIGDLSVPGTAVAYYGGDCYHKTGTYDIFQVYSVSNTLLEATVTCVNGVYGVAGGSNWTIAQVESGCTATDCLAYYVYDQALSNLCASATCDIRGYPSQTANAPYLVYSNGTNCDGATAGIFCFEATSPNPSLEAINSSPTEAQPFNTACAMGASSTPVSGAAFYPMASNAFGGGTWYLQEYSDGNYYADAGTFVSGGAVLANQWNVMFAAFNGGSAGTLTQLNNSSPLTTSQGTNGLASGDFFTVFANGGEASLGSSWVGACFITYGSVFGSTAVANMLSTWAAHFGGGIP